MSNWVKKPLGEIVSLQRGHDLPSQDREDGTIPIMGSSGITGYHNEAKAKGPGVVIGRSGNSMGEISFTPEDYWPLNTCLYVTDFKGNDERFIYYLLQTIDFDQFNSGSAQKSLNRNAVYPYEVWITECKEEQIRIRKVLESLEDKINLNRQTNQTLEQIAQAIFKSWFVDFDPVRAKIAARESFIQQHPEVTAEAIRAAAGTEGDTLAHAGAKSCELSAMCAISGKTEEQLNELDDDAIKQLRSTADLFPDNLIMSEIGEIPEGWRVKALDEIAVYLNGLALQKFPANENEEYLPVIKIAEMRSGITDRSGSATKNIDPKYIVENGDVLFSWSGSLLVKQWNLGEGALNQHLFKVTSDIYPKWLYYFAILHYLPWFQEVAASKATTMGHIQRKHLSDAKIAVCTSELLELGDKVIAPLLDKSLEVMLENRTLEEIRDSLLPKLLSGEQSLKVA